MSNRPKIQGILVKGKTKSGFEIKYKKPTSGDLDNIQKIFNPDSKNQEEITEELKESKGINEQSALFGKVFSIVSLQVNIEGTFYDWDTDMSNELPFEDIVEISTIIMSQAGGKKK